MPAAVAGVWGQSPHLKGGRIINNKYSNISNEDLVKTLRENNTIETRYAILKEVIYRLKGLSLFESQLKTAHSLQLGKIAELPTGEGKTLAAVVAAICYALDGHKVHILVFNDYLAKRDWSENRSIYELCGFTTGCVDQHSQIDERKAAYACDVVYVSAKQAGFDYLRGFLAMSIEEVVFPAFDVAIVDEADSIMIDECTTPMILAGEVSYNDVLIKGIDKCIRALSSDNYEISLTENKVWLTDSGLECVEKHLGLDLYDENNFHILSNVQNALDAHHLLARDVDYIIKDGAIKIIEETTGRIILDKRYPDALHRSVEIKEGLAPSPLTMTYNSITMQNFLKLYKTLNGMTGTAATSESEFQSSYSLKVDVIPPNTPSIRINHEDVFFTKQDDFYEGVIGQIKDCHNKNQPVLIGTKSVAESEMFAQLLSNLCIPHHVLNAKNDEEEANLIAQAGLPGRVTISTNMAGRGVDIRLGGGEKELHDKVTKAGGLYIIGAGCNKSGRIDNQLRGRAGRQGDPGESKFFIWLNDDDLSHRMSPLEKVKAEIGSSKKRTNTVRRIQRQMEGEAAEARYSLNRFSKIVEEQRMRLSIQRMDILKGELYFAYLEKANPKRYEEVRKKAGADGIQLAEKQLALYFINKHWAGLLEAMNDVKNGIHFMSLTNSLATLIMGGGQTTVLDEYARIFVKLCDQMLEKIKSDIVHKMETLPITKEGIDLDEAGLQGGSTTWSYAIDEGASQFNKLRSGAKKFWNKFSGEDGILTKYYRKKRGSVKTLP